MYIPERTALWSAQRQQPGPLHERHPGDPGPPDSKHLAVGLEELDLPAEVVLGGTCQHEEESPDELARVTILLARHPEAVFHG